MWAAPREGIERVFVKLVPGPPVEETLVSDNQVQPNPERDPEEWVTGDEPMTGPQSSYLQTLCQEAGEQFDPKLTKAQASERIDQLQSVTGRGA